MTAEDRARHDVRAYRVCRDMDAPLKRMIGDRYTTAHYDAGVPLIAAALREAEAQGRREGYLQALSDAEARFRRASDEHEAASQDEAKSVYDRFAELGQAAGLAQAINWCMHRPMHLPDLPDSAAAEPRTAQETMKPGFS